MYLEELSRQLALDYCCSPADVTDSKIIYTLYSTGRTPSFQGRRFAGLKIAVNSW